MNGVIWAGAIWVMLILALSSRGGRRSKPSRHRRVTREQVAIALVLLGTYSIVSGTSAEEVLRDPAASERIVRGALAGLGLLVVLPMLFRQRTTTTDLRHPGLLALTAYTGVAALSTVYSAAPIVTLGKVFELVAGVLIVWAIALQEDSEDRLRAAIRFVIYLEAALVTVAVVGFFAIPDVFSVRVARPGFLVETTMFAPYAHSNALSASGGLVAIYSLARALESRGTRSRAGWLSLFAVGTIGVVLASGRQGVVIWLVGVMVLLWVQRRRMFVFFLAPAVALVVGTYGEVIWSALVRGRAANIATLSGRVNYWEAAVESWLLHPFTGYGYGAGGRFVALVSIGKGGTTNLHSGYVETLVGLGILGAVPLLLALWRLVRWSIRNIARRVDISFAILIVPLVLHTAVSKGFAAWLTADFLLFGFLVTLAGISDRRAERRGARNGSKHAPLVP